MVSIIYESGEQYFLYVFLLLHLVPGNVVYFSCCYCCGQEHIRAGLRKTACATHFTVSAVTAEHRRVLNLFCMAREDKPMKFCGFCYKMSPL